MNSNNNQSVLLFNNYYVSILVFSNKYFIFIKPLYCIILIIVSIAIMGEDPYLGIWLWSTGHEEVSLGSSVRLVQQDRKPQRMISS
jgi:hypothetical protein